LQPLSASWKKRQKELKPLPESGWLTVYEQQAALEQQEMQYNESMHPTSNNEEHEAPVLIEGEPQEGEEGDLKAESSPREGNEDDEGEGAGLGGGASLAGGLVAAPAFGGNTTHESPFLTPHEPLLLENILQVRIVMPSRGGRGGEREREREKEREISLHSIDLR
jgi:hypothetical protein